MNALSRSVTLSTLSALAALVGCTSADSNSTPIVPSGTAASSSGSGGTEGATTSSSATGSGGGSAASSTSASSGSGGMGCGASKPTSFPYEPACCGYQVSPPDVAETGFDDGKGSGKPDHVHVGLAGPADTTFAVNWRTPDGTTATQLLVGTDKAAVTSATTATATVQLVTGHHFTYASSLDGSTKTHAHEAHACGLQPATTYFYKVGGPGAWSDVYSVSTAPTLGSSDPIRIAVLGDSRNDPTTFAKIEQAIAAEAPDLQLFSGDAVATGAQQSLWNAWFEASTGNFKVTTALASAPFMPVNGNHENLAINFPAQFVVPQHAEPGEKAQGEEYYSFDYGNAHFIAMNDTPVSGATGGAQLAWLEADLKAVDRKKTPWVFVSHHQSLYSCGNHGSNVSLRTAWQPLFDKYLVDMVFSGHDHHYERSKPIRGLSGSNGKIATSGPKGTPVKGSGTLYLLSGGAGAPLYSVKSTCDHTYVAESTRNYAIVDITGNKIHVKASRLDGTVLDEFEYTK